jgi:hypothetical protein
MIDPELVRDISERVYRLELGDDDARRMVEKDGDHGEKLRRRAKQYDHLTRSYLKAIEEARSASPVRFEAERV